MFWLVDNEIGLLWALHHKKQRLCIFAAKRRSTQLYSTKNMFWYVLRQNWALSSVIEPVNKFLFPVFSEWPWFLFDCLQKNVLACFWQLLLSFLEQPLPHFPTWNTFLTLLLIKNMFWCHADLYLISLKRTFSFVLG